MTTTTHASQIRLGVAGLKRAATAEDEMAASLEDRIAKDEEFLAGLRSRVAEHRANGAAFRASADALLAGLPAPRE